MFVLFHPELPRSPTTGAEKEVARSTGATVTVTIATTAGWPREAKVTPREPVHGRGAMAATKEEEESARKVDCGPTACRDTKDKGRRGPGVRSPGSTAEATKASGTGKATGAPQCV